MSEPLDYDVIHLMSQYWEVPAEVAADAFMFVLAAFRQAMAEFGVPDHPGGKCPAAGCQCSALEALVTVRAEELLGQIDVDGEACSG